MSQCDNTGSNPVGDTNTKGNKMKIAFLDVEASSLGNDSYPIEIAYATEDGKEWSALIKPMAHWFDWDEESEKVHNIPRSDLVAGMNPGDALAHLNHMVEEGYVFHTDAPSWDEFWISRIMADLDFDKRPSLKSLQMLVYNIYEDKLDFGSRIREYENIKKSVNETTDARITHRALDDAKFMREIYLMTKEKYG